MTTNTVQPSVPDFDIDEIVDIMRLQHGMDISFYDEEFLAKSLQNKVSSTGITTATSYSRHLFSDTKEAESLFHSLNITYSEFFRDPITFAVLEQVILPHLMEKREKSGRREIRIWSAACSAGQEAYSVAILLMDLAAAQEQNASFRIFATDKMEEELAAGRRGTYDSAAVQNVRMKFIKDYFVLQDEAYEIVTEVKQKVDFSVYDILDDQSVCPPASIYGGFDVVLCCNLLFYYRRDVQHRILNKISRSLGPRGFLVTGEAERGLVERNDAFTAFAPAPAIFQKGQ